MSASIRSVSSLLLALLLACGAASRPAWGQDADARAEVPEAKARSKISSAIQKEFRDAFRSKDASVRSAAGRSLLERAASAGGDPARKYVLLDQTVKLATGARDLELALDAVDRMAQAYRIDGPARALGAVNLLTRGAKETGLLAQAATACIDLAGDAMTGGDGVTAGKAIAAAKKLSKAAKMKGLTARANALSPLVSAFKRAAAADTAARQVLAATPDDPAACESAGRYLCFGRGKWAAGVEFLQKAPKGAILVAATAEAGDTSDAAGQLAVADAWWDALEGEKDALARARMLARATEFYTKALVDAPADRREAILARMDEVTYAAWNGGVALTTDFSKYGPANLALATVRAYIDAAKVSKKASGWRTSLPPFPEVSFAKGVDYFWHLDTNQGPIKIRFFADTAPNHVANFLYLTELGFFDDLIFHRVIKGFMAQGGCPKKSGGGDPGYLFNGEFEGGRKHDKPGILSMANTGRPKSDGSQFFITFKPTPNLDGKHTVFGEVVEGMDTVERLESLGTSGEGKPATEMVIRRATVSVR